ncbi:MAG: phosphoribosylformylglycinamidine synthase subunit PurL [Planctomycetaceae bacterium]|jgi:phosphoribosylformylglycinamidine synthase|nr:phosphoribosylformylglycinamidine synthase subunit PurL [Planctomycetaceae bacterium]
MLWEVEILPAVNQPDVHAEAVQHDAADLGLAADLSLQTSYGYLIRTADSGRQTIEEIAKKLLADPVTEQVKVREIVPEKPPSAGEPMEEHVYVLPKPGVTDSVAENARKLLAEFGLQTDTVRTFKKYRFKSGTISRPVLMNIAGKLLANDAVEQVVYGDLSDRHAAIRSTERSGSTFKLTTVPIRLMTDTDLQQLSKEGQLYLSLTEMQTIQTFFRQLDRDPSDIELETIAQTWSEHCSHKTLAGKIHFTRKDADGCIIYDEYYENMLKETIFAATQRLREENPDVDRLCVSVFSDNAGVVTFDKDYNVCFKVETHNHPSALEPYGGANTGLGGVIRDPMGTGLGAKPIASTDVFCFAPPDTDPAEIPDGVLHPRRVMKGVVSGVRDYGNRMGIPTVNGAVYFDKRYLGNPLVFCGNIGILPKNKSFKEPKPHDLIVAVGGRTGRDGIHGATFSSAELTHESESVSGGAVQIGNAITEKMVLDVMLQARDRNLYHAVTDCGAGGFSSAVGEMGEKIGAEVELSNAPLKYEGLSYTEIWISEAQERMVFAVPPEKRDEFCALCESEDVEAVVLGTFVPTGRLVLKYQGHPVADLDMQFLHNGRPPVVREAVYQEKPLLPPMSGGHPPSVSIYLPPVETPFKETLLKILSSLNVASKHWIIRQYDHEVQGGSVIKPLVGVNNDGPGDAAVIRPRLDSYRGLAVACGMNPLYGDIDPFLMAAAAIDEAVRNAVAVGADPKTIVLLDNFCWGNTEKPEVLGSLVMAAKACYYMSVNFGMPFISGKDSLNNEFRPKMSGDTIAVPPTLLISAMGQVADVRKCVTMDLKAPGNVLYQIGGTQAEFGGSHYNLMRGKPEEGMVPWTRIGAAADVYAAVHRAITGGFVRSVHDLSEGGLAVAVAEMCFAGGFGADLTGHFDVIALFSESNSRFVIEVEPENVPDLENCFSGIPICRLGTVSAEPVLRFGDACSGGFEADIAELKAAWQKPLDW